MSFLKALELALRVQRGEGPMTAMCPTCPDEVLVATLMFPGAEFYCLGCDRGYSFVDPRPETPSPDLDRRIEEANAMFHERFPR